MGIPEVLGLAKPCGEIGVADLLRDPRRTAGACCPNPRGLRRPRPLLDGIEIEARGNVEAEIAQPGEASPQRPVLPSKPVGFLHWPVQATDNIFLRHFIAIVSKYHRYFKREVKR